jgi:hypothetical protein
MQAIVNPGFCRFLTCVAKTQHMFRGQESAPVDRTSNPRREPIACANDVVFPPPFLTLRKNLLCGLRKN